jgi:hypothetical protein
MTCCETASAAEMQRKLGRWEPPDHRDVETHVVLALGQRSGQSHAAQHRPSFDGSVQSEPIGESVMLSQPAMHLLLPIGARCIEALIFPE